MQTCTDPASRPPVVATVRRGPRGGGPTESSARRLPTAPAGFAASLYAICCYMLWLYFVCVCVSHMHNVHTCDVGSSMPRATP